ncbi:MAG TPA: hypothetical protein VGB77_01970 [Abditibacteriaceae bacterium]
MNGDLLDEENGTFRVLLSTPVNATSTDSGVSAPSQMMLFPP